MSHKTPDNVVPLHPDDDLNVVTTTAERVDTLISDMRDLLAATERFHAQNAQEHHHLCGRLEQVENVLHSLASKLETLISVLSAKT
jgi:hypothetical protein